MADELKDVRDIFKADADEWAEAREERAKDLRYLAGDPWDPADKAMRADAGRPFLAFDELNQYVYQVVNDLRANPRAIAFAPADDDDLDTKQAEARAQFYTDKMREIEYRSDATTAYTLAAENAIQGGYGFVRVTAKYGRKSVRNQELWIEPVPDPDTIVFDPFHLKPDGSDAKRAFEIVHRRISEFKKEFPRAKVQEFDAYYKQADYNQWVQPDRIMLAKYWCVKTRDRKLVTVRLPDAMPPQGGMGIRPPVPQPPVDMWADELEDANLPAGSTVIDERVAEDPYVMWQLLNGVEVLEDGEWPSQYIPIIPCYGRILYKPEGGKTKRILMSMIRLARDPYMAYCYAVTGVVETAGLTTKNPYWAYEGQLSPAQMEEIKKSLHEPVAVLLAKLAPPGAPPGTVLPLPARNQLSPDLAGYAVLLEHHRRAIQSAIASNFMPTIAQKQNEKSGKALEKIDQASQKGTFHFIDHYTGLIRQTGVVNEDVLDKFYDARRKTATRKADDTTPSVWINDPSNPQAVNVKGRNAVTVADGPDFDSTREAASEFADALLGNVELMTLLGPAKAAQIAALAVKLKVRETGIGAIGEQIVDIIAPSPDKELTPEQMKQTIMDLQGQLQQAQQMLQQAAMEREAGLAKEQAKTDRDLMLSEIDKRFQAALQQLKGSQAIDQILVKGKVDLAKQDDAQRHDLGIHAADAEEAKAAAKLTTMATLAKPQEGGGSQKEAR